MAKIELSNAEEGMVITEPVKGPNGQPLLGAGVALTSKHIRILKTWGIPFIMIEGDEEEEDTEAQAPNLSAEALQQATKQQKPRFSHTDLNHPVMAYLFAEAVRQQAMLASRSPRS